MKLKFLILACSFFLIGCNGENALPSSNAPETPVENNTSIEIEKYSLADQAGFSAAMDTKDVTFCDKIENVGLKEQCKKDVDDQINYSKAVVAHDSNLCKNIQNADKQQACAIEVEAYNKQQNQIKEAQEKNEKMYEDLSAIINNQDLSQCKTLEDENLVKSCEYNILSSQALAQKDPNLCNGISDQESKDHCIEVVKAEANL